MAGVNMRLQAGAIRWVSFPQLFLVLDLFLRSENCIGTILQRYALGDSYFGTFNHHSRNNQWAYVLKVISVLPCA